MDEDYKRRYKEYSELTDDELIKLYLKDASKPGWTRSRMNHVAALEQVFKDRNLKKPIKLK